MAFLVETFPYASTPHARSNPKDGDLVIHGIAYDTATMLPRVGKNEVHLFDTDPSQTNLTYETYNVDSVNRATNLSGDPSHYYENTFAFNAPTVKRSMNYDRTIPTDAYSISYQARTDFQGRDWAESPAKHWVWDSSNDMYYNAHLFSNRYGSWAAYDGSNGKPLGNQRSYYIAPTYTVPNIICDLADRGAVCIQYYATTSAYSQTLSIYNYTTDPDLSSGAATVIGQPSSNSRVIWQYMGKSDNGDMFFIYHNGGASTLMRYENSTGSLNTEFSSYLSNPSAVVSVPSQVMRHNNVGENNPNKKVFYVTPCSDPSYWEYNTPIKFQIDTALNTITKTQCTRANNPPNITGDSYGQHDSTALANYWETRLISVDSSNIEAQKWAFAFQGHTGIDDVHVSGSFDSATAERMWTLGSFRTNNDTYYEPKDSGQWEDILTNSSRNRSFADMVPWCIAPLNPEHTLMMVFCTFSTHLLKFNPSASAGSYLQEVWYDENMIINDVSWLPTGKVLTSEIDLRFEETGGVVDAGRQLIQVWAEDMIYKIDITPDTGYVSFEGTNLNANVDFSAYNANNQLVTTDVKVEIFGPAEFDNGSTIKDVSLKSSGANTQTVTITGDGQIEFKVLEVQSI